MERQQEMVPLSVTIPLDLYRALERSRRRRMRTAGGILPRSTLVREALRFYLENRAQGDASPEEI